MLEAQKRRWAMTLSWEHNGPAAALGLATCLLIVPLWCVQTPGMPDYPAHIASFVLIAGGAKAQALNAFYAVHWALVPNLASELVVPSLAKLMPVETATKLFLSAAIALWVLGPAAIQRALFGKIGITPLAGAFFAYNANFTWGFFNYCFAAGLSFLLFAAWIASAKRRGPTLLAGFALAFFALYACHLVAVFLLLVMIACFEAAQVWIEREFAFKKLARRLLPIGLVFLPAAIAFLFFKPAGIGGGPFSFDFADTVGDRVSAAIEFYYDEPAYLLTGALAILCLWGLMYDRLRIHPSMKMLVIALAVLTLVAPQWALGGWGVHLRLPAVLGAILFASAELRLGPRTRPLAAAVLLLLAGFSAATLAQNWRSTDRQYGEFRAALRSVPQGSRMLTILDGDSLENQSDPTPDQLYWHMAEFAVVDRGAFTPLMFATKGQHIIGVKPPYDRLAADDARQGSPPDVSELAALAAGLDDNDPDIENVFPYLKFFQCHFDQAVIVRGKGEVSEVPDFLTLRHAGSFFSIYDIHSTNACAKR